MQLAYTTRPSSSPPQLAHSWEAPVWQKANVIELSHFRPEGSSHRPRTRARLLYDAFHIYGIFQVQDQFVRAVRTEYQGEVWKDSCVEFFVQPKPGFGYFNFEMNCGGTLLCSYVTDPTRLPTGLKKAVSLPLEIGAAVKTRSSLPKIVDPEIAEPCCWELAFRIPFNLFENYVGALGNVSGQRWRANFYKCAEDVSHPHWASWSPVDELNFHLPRCFGELVFQALG